MSAIAWFAVATAFVGIGGFCAGVCCGITYTQLRYKALEEDVRRIHEEYKA